MIDQRLQDALFDFQRTTGVVATIKSEGASKSGQLAEALAAGKKIVVCTIQTFPFALEEVRNLAATEGKRFAVIADEAHSSQTGEAAAKLKQVLSPEEIADLGDGGEVSTEDVLAAQMAARTSDKGITYVAFTATPKAKTVELFGRRPKPDHPAGPDNLPAAFHVYSMRQAIEEGCILDVLKNYTPYKLAFRLANNGKEWDDKEVERDAALKGIMRWVRLHPYNISIKLRRSTALPVSKSGSTSLEANETKPLGFFLLVVWLMLDHPWHFLHFALEPAPTAKRNHLGRGLPWRTASDFQTAEPRSLRRTLWPRAPYRSAIRNPCIAHIRLATHGGSIQLGQKVKSAEFSQTSA